mgnify:CR=1 FL=1|jgi:hypothetical protein
MDNLYICRYCGKSFISRSRSDVCSDCKMIAESQFTLIEQYLQKYPNSNALQIADGTGIAAYEVVKFIDEGRLTASKGRFEKI